MIQLAIGQILAPEADRREQREPREQIRIVRGELGGHHAAEGLADRHHRALQPERADRLVVDQHQIPQIVHQVDRLGIALAGPRMLGREDCVVRAQRLEEGVEMEPRGGVEIDQRRARAGDLEADRKPAAPHRDVALVQRNPGHHAAPRISPSFAPADWGLPPRRSGHQ